jgi:hypothetical protein
MYAPDMNKTKFRYFQVQLIMQNLHLKLETRQHKVV